MGGFTAVLEESELEAGAMRAVDVEGVYVLVSRSKDGQVCAIATYALTEEGHSTKANASATWLRVPGTVLSSTCALGKCCGDQPESPSSASRHAFAKGR